MIQSWFSPGQTDWQLVIRLDFASLGFIETSFQARLGQCTGNYLSVGSCLFIRENSEERNSV